ncbi:MAG: hypothetical protein WKG01_01545 [Kofleriaceae bacterium]
MLRRATLIVGILAAGTATADVADSISARGEQLAKVGRYSEAISAFKQADVASPHARHACLIGLAYLRRRAWSQAELFLTSCRERASATDPIPDWLDLVERELKAELAAHDLAPVVIRLAPAEPDGQIRVSSFAADERFAPRTIYLAVGSHQLTATRRDGRTVSREVTITDRAPREVVLSFESSGHGESQSQLVPRTMLASGAVVLIVAATYHAFVFKPARDQLVDASTSPDRTLYTDLESRFDSRRAITIAMYGVGAAVAIGGIVLGATVYRDRPGPRVTTTVGSGVGVIGIEWSR